MQIETYNEGDIITHYSFPYPRVFGEIKDSNKKIDKLIQVVVLGYGSLYDHSLTPNVDYITNTELDIFEFISFKRITRGEELLIKYDKNPIFMKKEK